MTQPDPTPSITVASGGPYVVAGGVPASRPGADATSRPRYLLCRCGGSVTKPFCDGSHSSNGFEGTEVADRGPIAGRRVAYAGNGVTVYDDRSVCAHVGYCTDHLARVFGGEPFVRATEGTADEIADVALHCPSGAISYALDGNQELVEEPAEPAVEVLPDGPYAVTGLVELRSADGSGYEVRARYALCRCGGSGNKPFCDGAHWSNEFKDG